MCLHIDKRERSYIELEMSRYKQYKKEIELERERIIDGSSAVPDGMPKGTALGNPTEKKAIRLVDSLAIISMERTILAVEKMLQSVSFIHKKIFEMYYIQFRRDQYRMCDELHISIATFRRYKTAMVFMVGRELGIIKNSD